MPIPEFVVELRRKIGQDLLWLPGVTAVVLREQQVLLIRRSDNGRWTPITGIVDPGEHPATAAVREVLEEASVTCAVEELAWVGVSAPVVHANGDNAQYLDHTFRCRYLSGIARPADDEAIAAQWFPLNGLPPMQQHMLERIHTAVNHTGPVRLS